MEAFGGLEGGWVDVQQMPADLRGGEACRKRCEQRGEGAAPGVEDADTLAGKTLLQVADCVFDAAEKDGSALGFEEAKGGARESEGVAAGKSDAGRAVEVERVDVSELVEEAVPAVRGLVDEPALPGLVVDEVEIAGEAGLRGGRGDGVGHVAMVAGGGWWAQGQVFDERRGLEVGSTG